MVFGIQIQDKLITAERFTLAHSRDYNRTVELGGLQSSINFLESLIVGQDTNVFHRALALIHLKRICLGESVRYNNGITTEAWKFVDILEKSYVSPTTISITPKLDVKLDYPSAFKSIYKISDFIKSIGDVTNSDTIQNIIDFIPGDKIRILLDGVSKYNNNIILATTRDKTQSISINFNNPLSLMSFLQGIFISVNCMQINEIIVNMSRLNSSPSDTLNLTLAEYQDIAHITNKPK